MTLIELAGPDLIALLDSQQRSPLGMPTMSPDTKAAVQAVVIQRRGIGNGTCMYCGHDVVDSRRDPVCPSKRLPCSGNRSTYFALFVAVMRRL